jgi:hypothetical protein
MASIRPHWRKMTWVVLIFNVIMVIWIIAGLAATSHPTHCQDLTNQLCNDANNTGRGIAVALLIVLWALGDVILGTIWLVTRGRSCPVCGKGVRKGLTACKACGHDFRTAGVSA